MSFNRTEEAILARKPGLKEDPRLWSSARLIEVANLLDEHFPIPDGWGVQSPDMTASILDRYYPIERAG